jgi:hypothetical protein
MKNKKNMIVIAVIMIFVLLSAGLSAFFIFGTREKTSTDIDKWHVLQENYPCLPAVDEMGEYTEIQFKHLQKNNSIFFLSNAYILKSTYPKDQYEKQKKHITNNILYDETVNNRGEQINASFAFDGFSFQMLSLEKYNFLYPKEFAFVGVSDTTNQIAFVFYSDIDLDYIDTSFDVFLTEECGWE